MKGSLTENGMWAARKKRRSWYEVLLGKPEGKRRLVVTGLRWEFSIKDWRWVHVQLGIRISGGLL
jgi:hypothetical protein